VGGVGSTPHGEEKGERRVGGGRGRRSEGQGGVFRCFGVSVWGGDYEDDDEDEGNAGGMSLLGKKWDEVELVLAS